MDITNILNTKEAAASGLVQAQADPSQRFQEVRNKSLHQPPGRHEQGLQQPILSFNYQPRSPTPSFVSEQVAESPASDRSMSSSAYSLQSGPSSEPAPSTVLPAIHSMSSGPIDVVNAQRGPGRPSSGDPSSKLFPCSTCGKGFARRSDLARHERIHSGIRPHVCDHPGCNKQFIQRSALTVHARVHTGEKPHMCETCGKAFSDSSSLARHRRIHSGKRPYKCPYADCQKTFTRRTTLTRHQNHHTGTIGEAAAATAAALAARPPTLPRLGRPSRSPTEQDGMINNSFESMNSIPASISVMSPSHDMKHLMPLHRNDYATSWRNPTPTGEYHTATLSHQPPTFSTNRQHSYQPMQLPPHHRTPSATSQTHYLPTLPSLSAAPRRPLSPHGSEFPTTGSHMLTGAPSLMQQHWQSQYHQTNASPFYPQSALSPRISYP